MGDGLAEVGATQLDVAEGPAMFQGRCSLGTPLCVKDWSALGCSSIDHGDDWRCTASQWLYASVQCQTGAESALVLLVVVRHS